jgi:hypothetical protein
MPGAKIPVLEIENLFMSDDGRGITVYNDGTNFLKNRCWTGIPNSSNSTRVKFFPAASSSGWVRVKTISGSSAEATYYIPVYSNVDTNQSS